MTSTPTGGSVAASSRPHAPSIRPPVDLRDLLDDTLLDQGPRPLCVPFALSLAHEAARTGNTGKTEPTAPEALWWRCHQQGQVSAAGTLLTHGGDALNQVGQPALAHWPYNPHLGVNTEAPPTTVVSPPWDTAVMRSLALANDGIEDDLEDALAAGQPIVLVLEVTDEFANVGPDGEVDAPDLRSPMGDYHAVLCVGAATDPSSGRRLLIRNSWSAYWGAGGYCWLPTTYLIAFAVQAAVVVV